MSSKLDHSHVVLETANETYKLAYNIKAVRAVSRQFGGLRQCLEQVQNLNFDAIRTLVVTGADLDKKQARELDDEILATGLVELVEPCAKYAQLLFTGAHPDSDDGPARGSDDDDERAGNASAD